MDKTTPTAKTLSEIIHAKLQARVSQNSTLYLLADGAGITDLHFSLDRYREHSQQLLYDEDARDIEKSSPYLIAVNELTKNYVDGLIDQYYGKHCLVFCHSNEPLAVLTKHFMEYIRMSIPAKAELAVTEAVIGFYDPRVLPGFLACLDKQQQAEFTAPIIALHAEDERNPEQLLTWLHPQADKLKVRQ
jgi:hypothetical protein